MPIVDTSWLFALFNADDAHHERAMQEAREPGRYQVPHVILDEFLIIMKHRLDGRMARRLHGEIIDDPAFEVVTDSDLDHVAEMYHARRSLSYADCVAASLAISRDQPLLTFDAKQARAVRSRRH